MTRRVSWLLLSSAIVVGCATWRTTAPLPTSNSIIMGQLVVNCDFPLSPEHRLLSELVAMRGYLSAELGLPTAGEPVYVYLFQSPQSFQAFRRERFPALADRRAFFVETDSKLSVYAQWGDRMAEDLRHEVTHGYLHGVLPRIPLWVDEGLAEYFEVPRDQQGLNRPHLELLLKELQQGTWQPDPMRLGKIDTVDHMQQIHYAEAWAWIHFLLHSQPADRQVLLQYIAALREHRTTSPLEDAILRARPDAREQLIEHLRWLQTQQTAPSPDGASRAESAGTIGTAPQ